MAFQQQPFLIDVPAAADLSSSQFLAVEFVANATGVTAANADTDLCGILQNKPASGDTAQVAVFGVTKAVASAAIQRFARVSPASGGKLATSASGDRCIGIALEPAGADNDVIAVLLLGLGAGELLP